MTARDAVGIATASVALAWCVAVPSTTPWMDVIAASLLAMAAFAGIVVWKPRVDALEGWLVVALLWSATSALVASKAALASKTTLGLWLVSVVVFCAVRRTGATGRRIVIAVLMAAAAVMGLAIVLEAVGMGRPEGAGIYANRSMSAAIIIPVAGWILTGAGRTRWTVVAGVSLAGAATVTGSRAAVLALASVVAVVAWRRPAMRRILVGLGALLAAVLAWRLLAATSTLDWHRLEIWKALMHLVADHPLFGTGVGDLASAAGPYRVAHPEDVGHYGRIIASAESSYLGVVVRGGLPVALPAFGALFCLVASVYRNDNLGVVAPIALMALFHDFMSEPAVLLSWAVTAGIAVGPPTEPSYDRRPSPGRVLAGCALGWLVAWTVVQPAVAWARWYRTPVSTATTLGAIRVEPWLVPPAESRVKMLLTGRSWTWDTAAEATALTDHLVHVAPGDFAMWSLRAQAANRVLLDLAPLNEAAARVRESWSRAVELEPSLPWARFSAALFERAMARPGLAVEHLERALDNEPNFARAWALLAQLEWERGRVDEARRAALRAREVHRDGRFRSRSNYDHEITRLDGRAAAIVASLLQIER